MDIRTTVKTSSIVIALAVVYSIIFSIEIGR